MMIIGHNWERYRTHLNTVHPEFASWDSKTPSLYGLTTAFFFGVAAVMAFQFQSNIMAAYSLISWVIAITALTAFRSRGIHRFRAQWNEEHGAPVNPV